MQETLLDTYTIALPIILGYIVWLLKRTNKKCVQDTNFSPTEYAHRVCAGVGKTLKGYFKSATKRSQRFRTLALLFSLNEHNNQSVKEGDDYLMSNKVNKFILPDGTEVDLAGGGETINVDAELKEYMNVVKPAIASAIINKGGSVEPDDSLNDYATRISAIPNDVYPAETLPVQTGAHDMYKAG